MILDGVFTPGILGSQGEISGGITLSDGFYYTAVDLIQSNYQLIHVVSSVTGGTWSSSDGTFSSGDYYPNSPISPKGLISLPVANFSYNVPTHFSGELTVGGAKSFVSSATGSVYLCVPKGTTIVSTSGKNYKIPQKLQAYCN